MTIPLLDRLMSKVVEDGECWIFTGALAVGYGHIFVREGRWEPAHRVSYELLVGTIPEGLQIDHKCKRKACVRPAHLEPVTRLENMRRAFEHITHCPQGHEYTPENLIKDCKKCHAAQEHQRRVRKRAS